MATYLAVFDTRAGVRRLRCQSLEEGQRLVDSLRPSAASWWLGRVVVRDEHGQRVWVLVDGVWTFEKRL